MVSLYSTIKMMHGPINIRFDTRVVLLQGLSSGSVEWQTNHSLLKEVLNLYVPYLSTDLVEIWYKRFALNPV